MFVVSLFVFAGARRVELELFFHQVRGQKSSVRVLGVVRVCKLQVNYR